MKIVHVDNGVNEVLIPGYLGLSPEKVSSALEAFDCCSLQLEAVC